MRGFEPAATWSTHWVADMRFRQAVGDFLRRETEMIDAYIAEAEQHLPFHKGALI
jgi:predicted N-acyltransferase